MRNFSGNHHSSINGFTLIELLVVVAIMAVISVVGITAFLKYRNGEDLKLAAQDLVTAVRDAERRSATQENGAQWGVRLTNATSSQKTEIWSGANYASGTIAQSSSFRNGIQFGNPSIGSYLDLVFSAITGQSASGLDSVVTLNDGSGDGLVNDVIVNALGSVTSRFDQGLVGYWHFDEGASSTAYDASGNGNNGQLKNSPTWAAGSSCVAGSCLNFNGSNQYVNVGNLSTFPAEGTISFWVNATQMASYRNPLTTNYNGGNAAIRFEENSSGNFVVVVGNDSGTYHAYTYISSGMSINTWYHIAYTWNTNTNINIGYLNGAQVFSQTNSLWPTHIPDFAIGTGFTTDPARQWNGLIDEVRIYNRALSAQEIQTMYNDLQ